MEKQESNIAFQLSHSLRRLRTRTSYGIRILRARSDVPPSYDGNVVVYFDPPQGVANSQLSFSGALSKGQRTVAMTLKVPIDTKGGKYVERLARFSLSNFTDLKFAPVSFEVIPAQGLVQPSESVLTLNLSQKQLLESQANQLELLKDDLVARLSADPTDTPSLRSFLVKTIQSADALLPKAEAKYNSFKGPTFSQNPPFFEDFHRSYLALLKALQSNTAQITSPAVSAHLLQVQLKRRQPQKPPENLAGSYPPVASSTIEWLTRNLKAYLRIEATGTATFTFSLASVPTGALISYMRTGETYKELSTPTDIQNQKLPLAMWTLKIDKDGCTPGYRHPDPYNDAGISYKVELACKKQ